MTDKTQVVVIHGGTTFPHRDAYITYLQTRSLDLERLRPRTDWKGTLQQALGESYDVLAPRMPNGTNAQYEEWVLWFERILPLLDDTVIFVGHSLGGIFLARYLSERVISKHIAGLFLVAAPYMDDDMHEPLASFALTGPVTSIEEQTNNITLYYSEDDTSVPVTHGEAYKRDLPHATLRVFTNRGHFLEDTFPELVADIHTL